MFRALCLIAVLSFASPKALSQALSLTVDTARPTPTIVLENKATKEVQAFVLTVDPRTAEARIYYDAATSFRQDPIIPIRGKYEHPLPRVSSTSGLATPKLRAVIFTDGSVDGENAWIDKLLLRRRSLAHQLSVTTAGLQDDLKAGRTKDEILTRIGQDRLNWNRSNVNAAVEERLQRDLVRLAAARNISGRLLVNGAPPALPVALSHLISFFDEWRKDVEKSQLFVSSRANLPSDVSRSETAQNFSRPTENFSPRLRPAMFQAPSCNVEDVSYALAPPDNCGNTTYELRAVVAGVTYDIGAYTSFGVCYGGYCCACNGNYVPAGSEQGMEAWVPEPSTPGYAEFSFSLDRWSRLVTGCSCDSPNPAGFDEVPVDSPYYTAVVVASCNP